jgi:hypothetical protein
MAENDVTDSARPVNGSSDLRPLMERGQIWSFQSFRVLFPISDRTLAAWKEAGFKVRQPGTKAAYVISDDVFAVILKLSEENIE